MNNTIIWIPITQALPQKDGKYLCTTKRGSVETAYYATNLYKIDKYDFCNERGVAGWYDYSSEVGFYRCGRDIIAWAEMPNPYEANIINRLDSLKSEYNAYHYDNNEYWRGIKYAIDVLEGK